jgi:hypothetical protein
MDGALPQAFDEIGQQQDVSAPVVSSIAPKTTNIASYITGSISSETQAEVPSITSPARHVEQPVYQSPPRGPALDSMALQENPNIFQSIGNSAKGVSTINGTEAVSFAAHSIDVRGESKLVYSPIYFDEAMISLTGSSGKSWRRPQEDQSDSNSAGHFSGFLRLCKICGLFGGKTVKLAPELEQDKEIQSSLFNTPFNADVDIHRKILTTIYVYFVGKERADLAMVGDHWRMIGFQSNDPAVEINRSGGVFNLVALLFFIEEFGIDAQALFREAKAFPFTATSISMAEMAFKCSSKGKLNAQCNQVRQFIAVTCRFYVGLLKEFGTMWKASEFSESEFDRIKKALSKLTETPEGISKFFEHAPLPKGISVNASN